MPNKRRCRHCKEYIDADTAIKVPVGAFCSWAHVHEYARQQKPVVQSMRLKEVRQAARRKRRESKLQDLPHQIKLTQQAMNKMIRLLDADKPCVSSGAPAGTYQMTAGHFLTVAAYPELRFIPLNIHGQSLSDNCGQQKYKKGDSATVRQGFEAEIARRYGAEALEWLLSPHPAGNYTCDELADLRKILNAECRRLEKGEQPSRDWRAIRDWREMLSAPKGQ